MSEKFGLFITFRAPSHHRNAYGTPLELGALATSHIQCNSLDLHLEPRWNAAFCTWSLALARRRGAAAGCELGITKRARRTACHYASGFFRRGAPLGCPGVAHLYGGTKGLHHVEKGIFRGFERWWAANI
jgi:hypothetical protein